MKVSTVFGFFYKTGGVLLLRVPDAPNAKNCAVLTTTRCPQHLAIREHLEKVCKILSE